MFYFFDIKHLCPILAESLTHFTLIKKKCKEIIMGLSVFINYWCIFLYHKCKVEYIELEVVKVSSLIIEKKN